METTPNKTPISYYGGKQRLAAKICKMIPEHLRYVEPFFGGGAVFFAKPKSKIEVINDLDDRVINFYRVMKTDFEALEKLIKGTLHSESEHRRAKEVLQDQNAGSAERAWAFWVQTNMSFGNVIGKGFAFGKCAIIQGKISNKRENFKLYAGRFDKVLIFSRDALDVIKRMDAPDTFFYLDPPVRFKRLRALCRVHKRGFSKPAKAS